MKHILFVLIAGIFAIVACQSKKESSDEHQHHAEAADQPVADTIKKSIPLETHAMVGEAHITILYTAPVTKGRVIWGGLVPFDEVWVTGAHKATSFEINQKFSVGDKSVPAGKYALFTIPGKEKWVFIINKNWEQHLADDYSQADDIVRAEVVPEALTEIQERLNYSVVKNSDKDGSITIAWEKIRISIPIKIE